MKLTLLFSKDASKVTVKTFIMLQKKMSILNKCCSFELSIHQRMLKKKTKLLFPQKY